MRRDVPEVQVGRQPARAVRVGVVVLGGVASELRLHERGETPASRPLAANRVSRRNGVVDWQLLECRGPLEQPRGGRPSPQDPGVDLGLTSRQAPERVLVRKLAQVRPELALDERAKRSRGRKRAPVRGQWDEAIRIDGLDAHGADPGGSREQPRDEERRIVVGDDDAGVL